MSTSDHPGRYFEDFTLGEEMLSPWRTVTAADILGFAHVTGEGNPLHTDPEFAANGPFGALVASGSYGLALCLGLFDEVGLFHGTALASLGIAEWRFRRPLLVDTRIRSRLTVAGLRRRTSVPNQGILDRQMALLNEDGELLQEGRSAILLRARG